MNANSPSPSSPDVEQVFVVPRDRLFGGDWPQGFVRLSPSEAQAILHDLWDAGRFMDRPQAESDPSHKQPIPYCILRAPDAVFCVQRTSAQGEKRLHGKLSIGIGGHVNPEPPSPAGESPVGADLFHAAMRRELVEELVGVDGVQPRAVLQGLLNDDSNAVGQVHVGLVYTIDWPTLTNAEQEVGIRETTKMDGRFRSLADLAEVWQDPHRLESWSRTLLVAGIGVQAVPR